MITKLDQRFLYQILETKKETVNYDFKVEFHKNKAELAHDILCLVNSRGNRDKYLIYGISKDWQIVGVTEEPKFSVADITDILMNAGINSIPHIEYHAHNLDNKKIFCLQIVRDITEFPYILMKDIADKNGKDKTVRAGVLYTRNNDRNIPINRAASYAEMEEIWKTKFGLNSSPLERMHKYINDTAKWKRENAPPTSESIPYIKSRFYYEPFPEFVIEAHYEETSREDFHTHWLKAGSSHKNSISYKYGSVAVYLKYRTTILEEYFLINADFKYVISDPIYYNKSDPYNNPKAFIDIKSLECKIAVILTECSSMDSYLYALKINFFPFCGTEYLTIDSE